MFFYLSKTAWLFTEPSNVIFTVALVGLAGLWLGLRRFGLALATLGIGAMLIVAVAPVGGWMLASLESRFPAGGDAPTVDGIVVLGGAIDAEAYFARRGSGLTAAVGRLTEAARLAKAHPSARLIFAGGPRPANADGHSEAEAALDLFAALGIDTARVTLEFDSRNTYENAVYLKRIAQPKPGEHWLLVTSAFHMPRAIGCFRGVDFPVTADPVDFRELGPLGHGFHLVDGLSALDLAAHEMTGLIVYRLTGKTTELFPGP